MQQIEAQPGTVSEGTMREEDLLSAFDPVLNILDNDASLAWRAHFPDIWDALRLDISLLEKVPQEERADALESIMDRLDACAPIGHYFGPHQGNGSDYGFWPVPEEDLLLDEEDEEAYGIDV